MKGAKGIQFNDRVLAAKVRTLTLQECEKHLKSGKGRFYAMVLSNLSRSVLPRLNELSGENGGPLIIELPKSIIDKNGINAAARRNSKG